MALRPGASRKKIVEPQPGRHRESAEPAIAISGKKESDRMNHVRRGDASKPLALAQRLIHQAKLKLRKITEAAVDEFAGSRGSRACKITGLNQRDVQPAHRRVARDRRAIDAAANDA